MVNLRRSLLIFFSLTMICSAHVSYAAEDVYLKGDKGHFKLEPGKVYHWDWTGTKEPPKKTGLPEKPAITEAPAAVEIPPAAVEIPPEAAKTETQAVEGEAPAITREAVAMMMSEIEEAANRKDIDSIAYYLAPDLVVFLTVDSPGGRQDLRLNKEEYLEKLQQGFSKIPAYSYRSENVDIIISQDGKSATIVEDIRETVGTLEAKTEVVSNQKSALEFRGGRIVVTKIVATEK
jgi:hypothetical protein